MTLENYRSLVTGKPQYFQRGDAGPTGRPPPAQFFTRLVPQQRGVTLGSTAISILVTTLAAYSLTRFRYWGRRFVPYFSLLGYMVPSIIFVFPLFLVMAQLGSPTACEPHPRLRLITLPFCMWLHVGLLPRHPDRDRGGGPDRRRDAACRSSATSCCRSAAPGIIAAAIFSLIVSWNDYLFGRVFLNSLND